MNILTGVVVSLFLFSFLCLWGSGKDEPLSTTFAAICAACLMMLTVLAGYWVAVLLGRL